MSIIHCQYCKTNYVYRAAWPNCPNCGAPVSKTVRRTTVNNIQVNIPSHARGDKFNEELLKVMRRAF